MLLIEIGIVEWMAFIASAQVGYPRRQVNIVQSVLYVVGIDLCVTEWEAMGGAGVWMLAAGEMIKPQVIGAMYN